MTSDREKIARIIDPICFKAWQSLYDYCLPQDGEETARLYADKTHKAECDEALAKADAILALSPPAVGDVERALGNPPIEADAVRELLEAAKPEDEPIAQWHVGLINDLERGKDVRIEAIAAIKNLERILFRAETAICEALALSRTEVGSDG